MFTVSIKHLFRIRTLIRSRIQEIFRLGEQGATFLSRPDCGVLVRFDKKNTVLYIEKIFFSLRQCEVKEVSKRVIREFEESQ